MRNIDKTDWENIQASTKTMTFIYINFNPCLFQFNLTWCTISS